MQTIGTHMSIAKGLDKAAENAAGMGADTMQIFSRNPRGSSYKDYTKEEISRFQKIREENGMKTVLAHAPYTMNLASAKEEVYEFANTVIREDVARMDALGIENIVFHPGSHTGIGVQAGIKNIIAGLDQALTGEEHIMVLLETMSGKGTEIGSCFEELKEIREGCAHPEKIGICLDTCHVYDAGYDIVNDLDGVLQEFHRVIGLERLKALHLNDSKNPFASHKDRHECIGKGSLGLQTFRNILSHPALQDKPMILETPNELPGYQAEIALLRRLHRENPA